VGPAGLLSGGPVLEYMTAAVPEGFIARTHYIQDGRAVSVLLGGNVAKFIFAGVGGKPKNNNNKKRSYRIFLNIKKKNLSYFSKAHLILRIAKSIFKGI
uniref:Uncharacterized protein n=1 Tax=Theropithecus gelada TaxID=9565 RepID=A0A8D2FQY7_THEGE